MLCYCRKRREEKLRDKWERERENGRAKENDTLQN